MMATGEVDNDRRMRRRILIGIQLYLVATLLGWLLGPLANPKPHVWLVVFFVAAYQMAFALGYRSAERRTSVVSPTPGSSRRGLPTALILTACLLSIGFSLASLVALANASGLNAVVTVVTTSILDPGSAYLRNQALATTSSTLTIMSTALSPLTTIGLPLGIYYFARLPHTVRLVLLADGLLQITTSATRGTNFGVFKVAVILAVIMALRFGQSEMSEQARRRARLIAVAMVPLFIAFFVVNTRDRLTNLLPDYLAGISIDYDNAMLAWAPDSMALAIVLIVGYLCQGYYGFGYTFDLDFTSTYGLGSSQFVASNIQELLGVDRSAQTYPAKMGGQWDPDENWHTVYTWWASDVSIWGVVAAMFLFGYLFSRVLQSAQNGEPLGLTLLPLLSLAIVFFPANNAALSNPLTGMPIIVLTAVFLLQKARSGLGPGGRPARKRSRSVGRPSPAALVQSRPKRSRV